jgi:hypothetical protein
MSSSNETAKKEAEREALYPFLDAYALATGQRLELVEDGENPDFICVRPISEGTPVGVELARITHGPIKAHWDRILDGKVELEAFDAQALVFELIGRKEEARATRYVQRVKDCMLVLQLEDGSLHHVRHALDGLESDFKDHGFSEIWIADYSGLDAYGNVELYGLYPAKYWGFHERPNHDSKPYG